MVDTHWAEIADHLSEIERIYEDESFSHKNLAAFLASKVFHNFLNISNH